MGKKMTYSGYHGYGGKVDGIHLGATNPKKKHWPGHHKKKENA
jgi:hypothetical protein